MNTLICENCGSSSFIKIKDNYQCKYCSSTMVSKTPYPKKRIKFIVGLLITLLIVSVLVYKGVVSVENKLDNLNITQSKEIKGKKNKILSDLDSMVREKIKQKLGHFPLENILKVYNKEASEKAFFISLDKEGKYAYGYTIGRGSVQDASKKAFAICEKARKKRDLHEVCIPYLINNHISTNLVE